MNSLVVVRGAGEMASGVIRRLIVSGFKVVALEQAEPSCIRRTVCFAEAMFDSQVTVDGVTAVRVDDLDQIDLLLHRNQVPVLCDPEAATVNMIKPSVLVDARMLKNRIDTTLDLAPIVIGLGPGFVVGRNSHAAVETNRGFDLGRVLYTGSPLADTGRPAEIGGVSTKRLIRSPADGVFRESRQIGDHLVYGETVGTVGVHAVIAETAGTLRGLIRSGLTVHMGQKIGDVDPRGFPDYCFRISDKANAIAGGVLEAVLSLSKQDTRV
ncbi:MAG: selenium-dependent molybdenum cofactor biosynthesis protein YqeB [Candidatus Zixiibacteriota bacterium]